MIVNISQEKRRAVRRIIVDHVDITKKVNEKSIKLFDHANFKFYNGQLMESKKELARKLWHKYLQCSTIHGVKYFGNLRIKSTIAGKLFWALIMLCSFLFSVWMIWKFLTRYNTNPTRSIVESFYAPIHMIPFPAVTFCPLVSPFPSRLKEVLKNLRLPYNMTNETANFLLRYASAFSNERSPAARGHLKDLKALLKINSISLMEFLKLLRHCEDFFESCWWNNEKKNCTELFKISYTFTGICCSFNYLLEDYIRTNSSMENDSKLLRIGLFGPKSGLKVVLHRKMFNHITNKSIRYSTNSIGLVMFSHHPLEYVDTIATRQILQAQQELWVAITPFMKKKSSGYYYYNSDGELVPNCADETTKLKYFPTYRYSNCFTSCSIRAAFQICGCVPYYYAPIAYMHSLRICEWEDWECIFTNANAIRIIQNVKKENFTCNCLNPCSYIFYQIQTSTSMLSDQKNITISPLYKNLSMKQAVLRVFLSSETFTIMKIIPIADRLYLLASLGGIFSLFMGCSFISSIEISYFIGLFVRSNRKKMK